MDVLGRIVQFLVLTDEAAPCVMRWTIPPGTVIPLHSQPDPETLFVMSGNVEGLSQTAEGYQWIRLAPGDVFHVPGGAKQALRNHWPEPAVIIVVATARLRRLFLEAVKPVLPTLRPADPPTPEAVRDFLETAARHGQWTATPEQNYQVGIDLPPAWSEMR
jgi:quercetin dioxygenase-like cupin family protein